MENEPKIENNYQREYDSLVGKVGVLQEKINVETDPQEKEKMIIKCGALIIERDLLELKLKK